LYITYPADSVELRGKIELDEYSGQVWSYGRALNDKNGYSIVYNYNTGTRIGYYEISESYYKYRY